jgi:hypothetical protein
MNDKAPPTNSLTLLLSPDSAVRIEAKSEEQTVRSEANGFLPLSGPSIIRV